MIRRLIILLIVGCEQTVEPLTKHGCLDSQACNYDADATIDNNSCIYEVDCAGVCGGSAVIDECEVCGGGGIVDGTCDCDGNVEDCASVCGGSAVVDECGICNGNGIADGDCDCDGNVEDCIGVCGGIAVEDDCGVCMGDGSTCISDIDGNFYQTIQIGEQLWMAENLKVTRYNDGSEIPNITNNEDWSNLSTGAYVNYDNNPSNSETYGRLYNWYAVDDGDLCMDGWHVPSDEEWTDLITYLDVDADPDAWGSQSYIAGGILKDTGTIGDGDGLWNSPNTGATNESGFTALPAGYRFSIDSYYYFMGSFGYFWSSSKNYSSNYAWNRLLDYGSSNVYRGYLNKHYGFSIRCLGD